MLNNWQNIHHGFIKELQQKWETEGFTYEQAQDWINIGLKPTDYKLASYIHHTLGYEPEEALNFADLETLRVIYQESLNEQFENLQTQPAIREPETIRDVPEIPPQQPTLLEELELTKGLALSLELSDGESDGSDSPSTEEEEEEISKDLKKYLQEKRLDLKRYFVFNIQELTTQKICDDFENVAYNGRAIKESLSEDLTKLAIDNGWDRKQLEEIHKKTVKKKILILAKENGLVPSRQESNDLDKKITNKEKLYILFEKNNNWVDWKGKIGNMAESDAVVIRAKSSFYLRSKKDTLRFLKDNDPALSGKKNLYDWWKEAKKIGEPEKERLAKIGIDDKKDSSDEYKFEELKRVLKYEDIAKQNKDKLPSGEGQIKKITFFSPPRFQDKDCAIIVSEDSETTLLGFFPINIDMFDVYLIVYEAPWKNVGNGLYAKKVKSYFKLEDAEAEADRLTKKLLDKKNPYPVCAVFDKVGDVFEAFSLVGDIEGVKGFKSPWSVAKNNPEGYFKPLDIVRIKNFLGLDDNFSFGYSHAGVYLGKDKNGKHKVAQVTKENNGLNIADWEELFSDKTLHKSYGLSRYHVFIPYKKPRIIRKHIARAYSSGEYNGAYALLFFTDNYEKGNCQQFANRAVLGLNITNEGTLFKNGSLKEEINRTNQHFANLKIIGNDRQFYHSVRRRIRKFANQADDQTRKMKLKKVEEGQYTARIVNSYPWKWKQPVELRPNENCKIQ
ncbi:MAG: hypothetical protein MRECE_2c069 [Mycoplasmataceae bacterium CE_OT135]|nr:MAG: hypothetical protein MRECE_2c069 [Mycoplasmataceae bacterium CE_OT135]